MTDQKKTKAQLLGEVTALRQKVAQLEEKTKLQQQSTRNFRRLFESEREQRQEIERLQQAGIVLHSSLNFETVLDYILEQVAQFITYDAACLMLVHEGNVRVVRWYGYARRGTAPGFALKTFNISDVPELQAMDTNGEPWLVPDASTYNPWIHGHGTRWVKSHLSAPIRIKGTLTGIIQLDSATPNFFNQKHANMLSRFIYQAAIAVG
ncbi:MAG: GAF domain-containing protein, partial [Chloroflexi bacterium]